MNRKRIGAFTALELLVVVMVVCGVLLMLMVPTVTNCKVPHSQIQCVSNLKNIGLAFRIFATDHGGRFPGPELSDDVALAKLRAAEHFAFITNELSSPKILICPSDLKRSVAMSFTQFSRENISYFSSLSADETRPDLWLAGDRNLMINGQPAQPGQALIRTNDNVSWSAAMHMDQGNIVMADGSVQQASSSRLKQSLAGSGSTNLLVFP